MSKHTPGPWQARGSTVLAKSRIGTNCTDADVAVYGAPLVCESIRSDANARLIAAAPDLLEALRSLELSADLPAMFNDPVRVKARAAIAKAEGSA
jgi:hypothetical protein